MKIAYKYIAFGFAIVATLPLAAQTNTQPVTTASSEPAKIQIKQGNSQSNNQTLLPVKTGSGKTTLASEAPVVTPRPVPQVKPTQQVKLPSEQ